MTTGQCLCGAHRFRLEGDLSLSHHCHCGFCRKSHGTVFGSLVGIDPSGVHWEREGPKISYRASGKYERTFCAECGSPLLEYGEGMQAFVPTGLLDDDYNLPAEFQIFAASKAPWHEIDPEITAFDAYPPGFDAPVFETRPAGDSASAGVRGSCLCGAIRYVLGEPVVLARNCHCVRCRRARGAAHATNLGVALEDFTFTAGSDRVKTFRLPDAKFFAQAFCGDCGSAVPRVDDERGVAIIPMGGLDDPPSQFPTEHIFVASKARWFAICDGLPQYDEYAPS